MISHQELLSTLLYDSATGHLTRLVRSAQRVQIGDRAGTVNPYGYRQVKCIDRVYKAHRLIWFYTHGAWPKGQIDHINGDRDDNRIMNLREATFSSNQANSKRRVTNQSGRKGVSLHKHSGLWHARIMVNYRTVSLGYFKDKDEAHKAYISDAGKYFGTFANGGEIKD